MTQTALPDRAALRLQQIARARHAVMQGGAGTAPAAPAGGADGAWIERSWRRCLAQGLQPGQPVHFDLVSPAAPARLREAHRDLLQAARPTLERLGRALEHTRYFAILVNAQGLVLDAQGAIDRSDRRAALIARPGVDLSERAVGTTAISVTLAEQQAVWLHRGEHFFDDNACYSCAGAPLYGPDGSCVGMLDLTGVDVAERPELRHLVAQSARSIENALTVAQPHHLLVRLNWPGRALGSEDDGLLALDAEGWVRGANGAARQMMPLLQAPGPACHCSELFAQPWEPLFDAARHGSAPAEMALWSGLRLAALPMPAGQADLPGVATPLRDLESALIHNAVAQAGGSVAQAAKVLGISRATIYRKLARKGR
ncbi:MULTISPECIES: helix-turn-helix domain-containing protein [Ramlibacter]|uniref:Histidine kinase n=1 Tax=Ramlibacter aquaticus TaxID=2780094 RepID=A0ABR9SBY6_9BURK|nr:MULTISPECIES: helix-turn-helix domain-containing protein [Ramlibacter]MBE7939865.1 histidine kinase [Ramlibacter aquaticus]